jgi:hypothetical protein
MLNGEDYLIIDNLVPKGFIEGLHMDLRARDHWAFAPGTLDEELQEKYKGRFNDCPMLTLLLFSNEAGINNQLFSEARTIFSFLEDRTGYSFDALGRIKANLTWPQPEHLTGVNPPHIDVPQDECISMVFYVNDSDGETVLYDKRVHEGEENLQEIARVEAKAGRALLFNSNRFHSSQPPVNTPYRIIINSVFIPKRI